MATKGRFRPTVFFGLFKKKEEKIDTSPQGGVGFFLSLFFGTLFLLINIKTMAQLNWVSGRVSLVVGIVGFITGFIVLSSLIRGSFAVFFHELKHSIFSNLAGNKAKEFNVQSETGHFKYAYTEESKGYNAFISLAPYWFPLFGILAAALGSVIPDVRGSLLHVFIVCSAYGIDLALAARDIGPHQTDIQLIRGGYGTGLAWILMINALVISLLLAWVVEGVGGLQKIFEGLWSYVLSLFQSIGVDPGEFNPES